jgi:hypothetical protein
VKVQIQKRGAIELALDRISERITLASNPKVRSGRQLSKNEIILEFQYEMAERESVNPH